MTAETNQRSGHGWWPYLLPYLSFVLLADLGRRMPEAFAPALLFIKPALPLILLIYFYRRGEYSELRSARLTFRGGAQDVGVGIALTLLWMLPYVLFPALRPDPAEDFDPNLMDVEWAVVVLSVRMFGYAIVTPLFEEVFIRSFVMRYAEVYSQRGDFRDVPIAHYTLTSFITTIVVFTIGHVPWEWWVAVPWVALTNLWFYHRRNLWALILVHGVTNASLLLFAIFGGGIFEDGAGHALSLWFFI